MKCPGQDSRYWKPDAIFEVDCPECGARVEFFKDDTYRRCKECGFQFLNPSMDFGCASYCKYAEQCIGNLPPELIAQRENLLKDRVAIEMRRYFKQDFKRIQHANRIAEYAERIGKAEGCDLSVVLIAAYLHDIGIKEAEKKYGSTSTEYQEKEAQRVARDILNALGAGDELTEEVCDIIGHHHHPGLKETMNFKVVYDADLITNLEEQQKEDPIDPEKLTRMIENSFLTRAGRLLAKEVLLT
jgi:HD superfamily phosphohydrolase YqeK